MAQVLVFGRNGQVASALFHFIKEGAQLVLGGSVAIEPSDWVFISSAEVKFENPDEIVESLNRHTPKVVINCSAYTAVDLAESERDKAEKINAFAPGIIAGWCAKNAASLVHFSTDYVYPGTGSNPWSEDSETSPVNYYGVTKLRGEQLIQASGCHYYIFRTSWIYSAVGNNFVKTMIRLGGSHELIKVVEDQVGGPTSARDLAQAVLRVLQSPLFFSQGGVFNLAGQGFISWYGFAVQIFEGCRLSPKPTLAHLKVKEIVPILSSEYRTAAVRPLNSRLDQTQFYQAFGFEMPPWKVSLQRVLEEI